jgi:hypothetical protein
MLGILDITGGLKTRSNALRGYVWRRQKCYTPSDTLPRRPGDPVPLESRPAPGKGTRVLELCRNEKRLAYA